MDGERHSRAGYHIELIESTAFHGTLSQSQLPALVLLPGVPKTGHASELPRVLVGVICLLSTGLHSLALPALACPLVPGLDGKSSVTSLTPPTAVPVLPLSFSRSRSRIPSILRFSISATRLLKYTSAAAVALHAIGVHEYAFCASGLAP